MTSFMLTSAFAQVASIVSATSKKQERRPLLCVLYLVYDTINHHAHITIARGKGTLQPRHATQTRFLLPIFPDSPCADVISNMDRGVGDH